MKKVLSLFLKSSDQKVLLRVDGKAISRAYTRRKADIDSLRAYDRGEKDIHAPNLRNTVQSV